MNCANHVDVPAVAYCRTCGKPLCSSCARDVRGVIYCEECLASHLSGTMPPPGTTAVPPGAQPETGTGSPGLAAILGFIPGVGAMYNGEYAKGFAHVLIFATLIWMTAHVNGIFGLGIAAFVIYMPIEAYQTARARADGFAGARSARPEPPVFVGRPEPPYPSLATAAGAVPRSRRQSCHRGRRAGRRWRAFSDSDWRFRPDRSGCALSAQRDGRAELRSFVAVLAYSFSSPSAFAC